MGIRLQKALAGHDRKQDEPLNGRGDGNTETDARWVHDDKDQVQLRAERSGQGDRHVDRITFTAKDSAGHDSGDVYDSFGD